MAMPISPELQAKIDALTDENLKANILRYLNRPWQRAKSNEQIFEEMVARSERVMAERAKWRKWTDEEVAAFVAYFEQKMSDDFAEYIRQDRDNNEINSDLSWKLEELSKEWLPGLATIDYILLLGKVRDYFRATRENSGALS
jgi:hypothetical protein